SALSPKLLPTLRPCSHEHRRTARGRCGSLLLHHSGLSPPTPCRSPGALTVTQVVEMAPPLTAVSAWGSGEPGGKPGCRATLAQRSPVHCHRNTGPERRFGPALAWMRPSCQKCRCGSLSSSRG